MKFLPFETITLETKLTEEETLNRLSGYIEPKRIFRFLGKERERPYEGTISNQKFKMRRIASSHKDIIPVIVGSIEKDFDKIIIILKFRLSIRDIVFFSGLLIFLVISYVTFFLTKPFNFSYLLSIAMVIATHFIIMYRFKAQSSRAKIDLQKLLEAKEV